MNLLLHLALSAYLLVALIFFMVFSATEETSLSAYHWNHGRYAMNTMIWWALALSCAISWPAIVLMLTLDRENS